MKGMLALWQAAAEAGMWQICTHIGNLYERGTVGVAPNTSEALRWYRRAVYEGDDPMAHVALARAHLNGVGVDRNAELARKHIERGLFYGVPEAAIYMALLHLAGVTTKRSVEDAVKMFESASSAGYPYARMRLAAIARDRGRLWTAVKLAISAVKLGRKIAEQDPEDPRLFGIEGRLRHLLMP